MRFFIFIAIFLGVFHQGFTQQTTGPCKIKGRIIDSSTHQPIDYATVTVFLKGSTKVAGGIISDESGKFTIDNLQTGEYVANVDFIGYGSKRLTNIVVTDVQPVANLKDIKIASSSKKLEDVTITGNRSFMESHLDKFVFNVGNDLTSQGGVATDILRKVPQVSVDVDGNVELLGTQNIRVFINGLPSTMFDNNLAEALQSIPASQIKSIEIITSPGAQYDAQGTGGIINIILKDNKAQGINGTVSASIGTRTENGSANIHAKKGNLDLNASLSGNAQLKGTTLLNQNRITTDDARIHDSALFSQNGKGTFERNGYRGQLGMDWAISKKQQLTASVSYNNYGNLSTSSITQLDSTVIPINSGTTKNRNSNNTNRNRNIDWNINYLRKFSKEDQELSLSVQQSYGRGRTDFSELEQYPSSAFPADGDKGYNKVQDNETYLIADYAQPVGSGIIINTGAKATISRINSNSSDSLFDNSHLGYNFDSAGQDNFNFNREIYAAYVTVTIPLPYKFTLKMGIRDEYTNINIPADSLHITPSYNSVIPSVTLMRKLKKNQTIKATYYGRIQRAGYRELNPFYDATDPTNLVTGNPYLKPERTNAGEVTYFRSFDKGSSLMVMLYYRNTRDDEQSYILHYTNKILGGRYYSDVSVTTHENAGTQQMTGINISGNLSLSKKFELRGNFQVFNKYIQSELIPGNTFSSYNYRANFNASYQFSKTLAAEFFANFNSPRTEIQGKFPSYTSYSFAVRKQLFKKKGSIGFTTTNPFNKYTDQATNLTGQYFTYYNDRKVPNQSFGLTFSYKFGKLEFKEKKQEKDQNNPDTPDN